MLRLCILAILYMASAWGWSADRFYWNGKLTNFWILSCNDGTAWVEYHPANSNGPEAYDVAQKCKNHGGIVVAPHPPGTMVEYEVFKASMADFSNVTLGDLVEGGGLTPETASGIAQSSDRAVWAKTAISVRPASGSGSRLQARTTELPDPRPSWWWPALLLAAAGGAALAWWLFFARRPRRG